MSSKPGNPGLRLPRIPASVLTSYSGCVPPVGQGAHPRLVRGRVDPAVQPLSHESPLGGLECGVAVPEPAPRRPPVLGRCQQAGRVVQRAGNNQQTEQSGYGNHGIGPTRSGSTRYGQSESACPRTAFWYRDRSDHGTGRLSLSPLGRPGCPGGNGLRCRIGADRGGETHGACGVRARCRLVRSPGSSVSGAGLPRPAPWCDAVRRG